MDSQGSASLNQVFLGVSSVFGTLDSLQKYFYPFEESKIQCSNKTTSRILLQRVMSAAGKKKKKRADEEAAEVRYYSL